jgi:NhaP-type Na+/H+ or K+/H+ antiporter
MLKNSLNVMTMIPCVGIFAQWLSWRFRLPSILLLLLFGFVLGPILGVLNPDEIFGETMFPLVSLSVAIILFEGGLSLKITDLKNTGSVVRNLITVGALVTWISISAASYAFLELGVKLSLLLGGVLVVTGPTVIIPMLKQIRVKKSVSSVLRWEGIMIDPVGATLAVLIFDVLLAQNAQDAIGLALFGIFSTLFLGVSLGGLGAFGLLYVIKKRWIPEFLQEAATLMTVIGIYTLSNAVHDESGLLVVTVMGIVLANQKVVEIRHIVVFKEQLTLILLSSIFILLSARLDLADLTYFLTLKMGGFLLVLFFLSRPLAVFISSIASPLKFTEKMFLSFMAPRGIVAVAVMTLFSFKLEAEGFEKASHLVPITFIVVVFTVAVYAVLGGFLATILGLKPLQKGIVIVGGQEWSIYIAKVLMSLNLEVLIVDNNKENIIAAKAEKIKTIQGSILSPKVIEEIEFGTFGHLLALTSNDEVNFLAYLEYAEVFGHSETYRLRPKDRRNNLTSSQSNRFLFGNGATHPFISARIIAGAKVQTTALTKTFSFVAFKEKYPKAIPLFLVNERNQLRIFTENIKLRPANGHLLISLI